MQASSDLELGATVCVGRINVPNYEDKCAKL